MENIKYNLLKILLIFILIAITSLNVYGDFENCRCVSSDPCSSTGTWIPLNDGVICDEVGQSCTLTPTKDPGESCSTPQELWKCRWDNTISDYRCLCVDPYAPTWTSTCQESFIDQCGKVWTRNTDGQECTLSSGLIGECQTGSCVIPEEGKTIIAQCSCKVEDLQCVDDSRCPPGYQPSCRTIEFSKCGTVEEACVCTLIPGCGNGICEATETATSCPKDCEMSNPYFNKYKTDMWGLFYTLGTPYEHNGPSINQLKFADVGTEYADAWILSQFKSITGSTIELEYEIDTWYSSRGDSGTNYYKNRRDLYDQGNNPLNNYGGGLRVKKMKICNGLNGNLERCETKAYDYNAGDFSKSSGSATVVPTPFSLNEDDKDIRRIGHTGGIQGSGGILYNRVSVFYDTGRPSSANDLNNPSKIPYGYEVHYFLTTDSNPDNTGDAIDIASEDGFSGMGPQGGNPYDVLGGSGTTDKSWARGQEYKNEYYDSNNNLVMASTKYFNADEESIFYLGDEKLKKIGLGEFDFNDNAYGISIGSAKLVKEENKMYDSAGDSVTITKEYSYNEKNGLINEEKITYPDGKKKIITTAYSFEADPSGPIKLLLSNMNMISQIAATSIYEEINGIKKLKKKTQYEYSEVGIDGIT